LNAIGGVGGALIKAGVHGIIGGALSVAQGGSFLQGFVGSAIGALGGYLAGNSGLVGTYGDGDSANILGRALISGAAGCLGAVVTGGKCAQAALTAAFASMYNGDGLDKGWHSSNVSKVGTLGSAAAMSAGWLFGIGPTYYEYGPETPQSIEMGQARSVSAARELYYRKN
jgi:hypothetical protein